MTQYTDANNFNYTILCGFDVTPGSDKGSVTAQNMTQCLAACDTTSGCTSVTLSGQTCYMRSIATGRTISPNIASANMVVPAKYSRAAIGSAQGSTGCGGSLPAGVLAGGASVSQTFVFQGLNRTYRVHVPSTYDGKSPAPLIFGFHGKGEAGSNFEGYSYLSVESNNPYGISIYPDGINGAWQSDPSTIGANPYIDDQSFVTALFANLQTNYCIDNKRIWGTGFSNGGGFIGVMACNSSISTTFSAFAAHSGALYTNTSGTACTAGVPDTVLTNNIVESVCAPGVATLPFMEIHGDNDGVISYFGGPRQNQCLPSLPHYVQDWAARDGLPSANVTTVPTTNVTLSQWGSGVVSHYRITGWGHVWSSKAAGAPVDTINNVMDFFYKWSPSS